LTHCQPQVVVCEATLPDADWRQVLGRTSTLKNTPRVIVVSSQADESLWAEVLNLGGFRTGTTSGKGKPSDPLSDKENSK
jgi:hypothetical protein